jgi:hypothetical protein
MREIRTSGLMSGEGKRGRSKGLLPRLSSTLPVWFGGGEPISAGASCNDEDAPEVDMTDTFTRHEHPGPSRTRVGSARQRTGLLVQIT